jgi:hypothetical protein
MSLCDAFLCTKFSILIVSSSIMCSSVEPIELLTGNCCGYQHCYWILSIKAAAKTVPVHARHLFPIKSNFVRST